MNTKKIVFIIAIILLIGAIGAVVYKNFIYKPRPWNDKLENDLKEFPDCPEKDMGLRDQYKETFNYLPRKMFCELPAMPTEFIKYTTLYKLGKISDFQEWGPEMWMQPEFINEWEKRELSILQNPPSDRIGLSVPIVFPSEGVATVMQDTEFKDYFTVRTSPLSVFYLGLATNIIYPPEYNFPGFGVITQNVSVSEEHIKVNVSPNEFMLEPSYPIFRKGYVSLMTLTVTVDKDTPPGKYLVGLNLVQPSREFNKEAQHKYLNLYYSGVYGGITRPWYVLYIEVVPSEKTTI